jgi:hypothetical protein
MADEKPKVGDLKIDLSALTYLKDIPPGGLRGLQSEKDGLSEALAEIEGNQKEFGALAKITQEEINEVLSFGAKLGQLDDARPVVAKLLEMIDETRAVLVDRRERRLHSMAKMVDVQTNDHPELPAKYETLRRYRSATGVKAAQTRAKNAAEETEASTNPKA